jgi:imidazolonepropionase
MTENEMKKGSIILFNVRVVTPLGNTARKGKEMASLYVKEKAVVEVTDGIITYVGDVRTQDDVIKGKDDDGVKHIDGKGCCLLPGFVDSHTHPVFDGDRIDEFKLRQQGVSYMDIMKQGGGIAATVRATRASNAPHLYALALPLFDRMSKMGVTTVEAKSGYGLDKLVELRQLQVLRRMQQEQINRLDIVPTYLGAHAVPEEFSGQADEYITFIIDEVLPKIAEYKEAEYCDVFCEEGVFTIEQSSRLLTAAKKYGLGIRLHADEIASTGGAELAVQLGAASADHLLQVSDAGIYALSQSDVVATLLPITAFILKEPYAPARRMIDAGCAVALATDFNPGSAPSGSIPLTMSLAALNMNMTTEEIITALTLNGAAALNRADRIGSIEVGKQADLVLLDTADYRHLTYHVAANNVSKVWKRGVKVEL